MRASRRSWWIRSISGEGFVAPKVLGKCGKRGSGDPRYSRSGTGATKASAARKPGATNKKAADLAAFLFAFTEQVRYEWRSKNYPAFSIKARLTLRLSTISRVTSHSRTRF